jgi:hypothetical protein
VRYFAIAALGLANNWYDVKLIESFLQPKVRPVLKVGALEAIWNTSGLRALRWKPTTVKLLDDCSPWVVLSAVDPLTMIMYTDAEVMTALKKRVDDPRFSWRKGYRVGEYIRKYL